MFTYRFTHVTVPRKVLKDRFDYSTEPDEPVDPDGLNKDDLYDEDQFYRESEAVPPAPKLHRELSNPPALADPFATAEPSSSANPPMRSREGNHLEGMLTTLALVFVIPVSKWYGFRYEKGSMWLLANNGYFVRPGLEQKKLVHLDVCILCRRARIHVA